ncbi:MAG TPA: pyruvate kinase [Noviherbaspirillum sp.]|uniref:pyruvate kinase n=1 Tax=Noviherbaspirillum sp. TaxID=1926288 RepID=UPI002B45FE3C|nr:pyruvate kinase [Noviherbaspirillum sp.]HJV84795.1 pyruvate kinase [Noviherbaspirillum sp.]
MGCDERLSDPDAVARKLAEKLRILYSAIQPEIRSIPNAVADQHLHCMRSKADCYASGANFRMLRQHQLSNSGSFETYGIPVDLVDLAGEQVGGTDEVGDEGIGRFVQNKSDLAAFHEHAGESGKARTIAKIECREALANLTEIVAEADAIMIVREALSIALPVEDLPTTQRAIVRECLGQGKPVIGITQMLNSMERLSLPTAAEASHVASAVSEGMDAVVLSAETASGNYPAEAVAAIDRIAQRVESDAAYTEQVHRHPIALPTIGPEDAIGAAVRGTAEILPLCFTAAYTFSGSTCLSVARARPRSTILGLSPSLETARMLSLVWGVHPIHSAASPTVESMLDDVFREAKNSGFTESGRPFVVVAGMPFGTPGSTNLMRIAWT